MDRLREEQHAARPLGTHLDMAAAYVCDGLCILSQRTSGHVCTNSLKSLTGQTCAQLGGMVVLQCHINTLSLDRAFRHWPISSTVLDNACAKKNHLTACRALSTDRAHLPSTLLLSAYFLQLGFVASSMNFSTCGALLSSATVPSVCSAASMPRTFCILRSCLRLSANRRLSSVILFTTFFKHPYTEYYPSD